MAADDAAPTWDPEDMEKAAYHEVGHAVVARSFNLTVVSIHLDLDEQSGHIKTAERPDDTTNLIVLYAGFEAEDMFRPPATFLRADEDRKNAWTALKVALKGKSVFSPQGRKLEGASRASAQERIRMHKAKIPQIAQHLMQPPYEVDRATFERMMQKD